MHTCSHLRVLAPGIKIFPLGVQHSEMDAATAGTVQSENHAAINPFAHGQTNAYDLGIALGIAHQMVPQSDITFQTVTISH